MQPGTLVLLAAFCAVACWAQSTEAPVPLTQEPSHHLALENEYTSVLQVEAAAHASTRLHEHDRDYVFVSIGAAEITSAVQGQSPAEMSLADGDTRFVKGAFAHVVINRGAAPFRNVTVEIKKKSTKEICGFAGNPCPASMAVTGGTISIGPAGMASADVKFTKETVLETDAVRASRLRLEPGGETPEHEDELPRLLVAVSDLDLTNTPRGEQAMPVKNKAGDIVWLPPEGPHTVSNNGDRPAQFVILEFK